jgi:hypothetical protein
MIAIQIIMAVIALAYIDPVSSFSHVSSILNITNEAAYYTMIFSYCEEREQQITQVECNSSYSFPLQYKKDQWICFHCSIAKK